MSADLAIWGLVAAAVLGTYLWRWLGVLLGSRIDTGSALFRWVSCVSYAMLAGLISRMLLMPIGGLLETSLAERVAAMAIGFAVFFMLGRQLAAGTATAVLAFIALQVVL